MRRQWHNDYHKMDSYFHKVMPDMSVGGVMFRFTRAELRAMARAAGVSTGRNKLDTVRSLIASGCLSFSVRVNFSEAIRLNINR